MSHIIIAASELRKGDLLRIGLSSNYVLVADATEQRGKVHVTVYNGSEPMSGPTLDYRAGEPVQLSRRNFPV